MAEVVIADYKQILKFVEKVLAVLSKEEDVKYYTKLIKGIRDASGLDIEKADEDRRNALLAFNAVSLANQVVFSAFSEGDLTENLENEYRALPKINDVADTLNAVNKEYKGEEEALNEQLKAFRDRSRKFDLVHAVCAGRSVDEAKKMQKEYDKQVSQSLKG